MLYKKLLPLLIPITLIEILSMVFSIYWLGVLILPIIFLWISRCRLCRLYESIWLFIISSLAILPYDVVLMIKIHKLFFSEALPIYFQIPVTAIISISLFSAEEVVIGIVGRIVWRKQRRVKG